jgi:hypothetical protein
MDEDERPEGAGRAMTAATSAEEAPDARRVRRRASDGPLWTRTRGTVAWSDGLARRLCERVASGELLYAVCREAGMPTTQSVARWARERPDFGEALMAARRAGGRPARGGGGVWTYCEATAREIFHRFCEGESLTAICRDPTMPSISTVYYWRRALPEFNETLAVAREIQAEGLRDLGWEMAQAATPENAYLTHVRLTQLRWMTGTMAPKIYRTKPVEPEVPRQTLNVLFRHFKVETDPITGKDKVVGYCPNPETGEVEREDAPGWRAPPGSQPLPA